MICSNLQLNLANNNLIIWLIFIYYLYVYETLWRYSELTNPIKNIKIRIHIGENLISEPPIIAT